MPIDCLKVRLMRKPFTLAINEFDPANYERHVTVLSPQEGFSSWQECLDELTEFDLTAFKCWSVTMGGDTGHTILVLFDEMTSHPHFVQST